MTRIQNASLFVLAAILVPAWPAQAELGRPDLAFNASAGYRYDSNVNLASTDTSTGEGDTALLLGLGIDGSVPVGERFSLGLGYKYTSTEHATWSDFDLAIHHARASAQYRVLGFDSGLSFDRFVAHVDHERFLDVRQASPSVSRLIGEKLYLRGSYTRAEKSYPGRTERDAVNDAIRGDLYFLLDGMQRYLAFAYRMDSEDARSGELDYDGTGATITYAHRLDLIRFDLKLKARLQFENRDYAEITESIGAARRDRRFRAGISAAMPLWKQLSLLGEVEYADNASNFASADFHESVYSLNVAANF